MFFCLTYKNKNDFNQELQIIVEKYIYFKLTNSIKLIALSIL